MWLAQALSLLMAEAGGAGKVCTFSSNPELVDVPYLPTESVGRLGEVGDLGRRADSLLNIEWGMNTDVDRMWDLLIALAVQEGWSAQEVAAAKVVILSDMEFDEARNDNVPWETAHETTCRK